MFFNLKRNWRKSAKSIRRRILRSEPLENRCLLTVTPAGTNGMDSAPAYVTGSDYLLDAPVVLTTELPTVNETSDIPESVYEVNVGDTLYVSVFLKSLTDPVEDHGCSGGYCTLYYDPALVTPESYTAGSLFSSMPDMAETAKPGEIDLFGGMAVMGKFYGITDYALVGTYSFTAYAAGTAVFSNGGTIMDGEIVEPFNFALKNSPTLTNDQIKFGSVSVNILGDEPDPEITDVSVAGYTGTYDGEAHTITVSGLRATDTVTYAYNGRAYDEAPEFTDVGTYDVSVTVQREGYRNWTGSATVDITAQPASDKLLEALVVVSDALPSVNETAVLPTSVTEANVGDTLYVSVYLKSLNEPVEEHGSSGGYCTLYYDPDLVTPEAYTAGSLFGSMPDMVDIAEPGEIDLFGGMAAMGKFYGITGYALVGTYSFTTDAAGTATFSNGGAIMDGETVEPFNFALANSPILSNDQIQFGSATVTIRGEEPEPEITDVTVEGYTGYYDGKGHTITVNDPHADTDEIIYTYNGKIYSSAPRFTDVGTYTVGVTVLNDVVGEVVFGLLINASGAVGGIVSVEHLVAVGVQQVSEVLVVDLSVGRDVGSNVVLDA